ncbi:MAG: hypothetical protein ABJO02_02620 [Reichenbachiella sp.]|uniref:hypothetical protein n=1 Tax=Reichenbachiella sp. TaxID=2184521 RepID=UPI00329A1D8C
MGIQDLIITPFYFFILLIAAYMIRPLVTNSLTKKYFIPGLLAKFLGAIAIGLVYQFYYSWGDTYTYFREARIIWNIFLESPESALRLIFQSSDNVNDLFHYTNRLWTFKSSNNYSMVRILSFLNLFTFSTYSSTALLLACFSFTGSWAFYSSLCLRYTSEYKNLALAVLFIPSVIIWGSGIFKDTITFGALMWLAWSMFNLIENRKISSWHYIVAAISIVIIAAIKVYILICFIPMVAIWYFLQKAVNIKNVILKLLALPFLIVFAVAFAIFGAQQAANIDEKYAFENLATTAQITAYDIAYYSGAGGSTYTLGSLDGSWNSMLKLTPQAINVSIFRPYLWEVSNPLMLLSAFESLLFTLLTIKLIFRKKNLMSTIIENPFLLFCLTFSIIFAFAVGISTFNFGTLVRYKIPLMPFYAAFLVLSSKK